MGSDEPILDVEYYKKVHKVAGKSDVELVMDSMKEQALRGRSAAGKVFLEARGILDKRKEVKEANDEVHPDRLCEAMLRAYGELREGGYRVDKVSGVFGVLCEKLRLDTEQGGAEDSEVGGMGASGGGVKGVSGGEEVTEACYNI